MFRFSSPRALWLPILIGATLLACTTEAAPSPANQVNPASPQALESPPSLARETDRSPQPRPSAQIEAAAAATVETPAQPPTRAPLPFIPPTLPPILRVDNRPVAAAVPTATEIPAPTAIAALEEPAAPIPRPETTTAPEPAAVPQPTVAPTAQREAAPIGGNGAGIGEIAAQLAELGSALKWMAGFDSETQSWSVYDPSGTFDEEKAALGLTESDPVEQLVKLRDGYIYEFAISRDAVLQGRKLYAGRSLIVWSNP